MDEKVECTKCMKAICLTEHFDKGASNCPTKTKRDVIKRVLTEYDKPEVKEFAR